MKSLLIPLILALLGTGGGVGAALILKPPTAEVAAAPCGGEPASATDARAVEAEPGLPSGRTYAKLNNQFIVPVVNDEAVTALVVLSISLEVVEGMQEAVFSHEPKLRDAFLQVLFDHANVGGFEGVFTANTPMRDLRAGLLAAARDTVGAPITDVLITEMARQDM